MKKWYAIQHGSNFDLDDGYTVKREAIAYAKLICKDHDYDGEEIRIAVCNYGDSYVLDEIIIREGDRI